MTDDREEMPSHAPTFGQQQPQRTEAPSPQSDPAGVRSSSFGQDQGMAPPARSKRKLILLLLVVLIVGGAAAAIFLLGLFGDDKQPTALDPSEPAGFGLPDNRAPVADDGPYVPLDEPASAPSVDAPPGFDIEAVTQQCTDKFNNDIRARGQNPDDFAQARADYVRTCVDYVRQQMAGQ